MVGAFGGGITAMICRDKQYIIILHGIYYFRQSSVQFRQGFTVAFHVVSMPIKHVKIYKVNKQDPGKVFFQPGKGTFHAIHVTPGMDGMGYAASVEYVLNLPYSPDLVPMLCCIIQYGLSDGR